MISEMDMLEMKQVRRPPPCAPRGVRMREERDSLDFSTKSHRG